MRFRGFDIGRKCLGLSVKPLDSRHNCSNDV